LSAQATAIDYQVGESSVWVQEKGWLFSRYLYRSYYCCMHGTVTYLLINLARRGQNWS